MTDTNATPTSITTFGSREKETTNQVRYTTGWGVVYIPKTQAEKLGNPENIRITVEVQQ